MSGLGFTWIGRPEDNKEEMSLGKFAKPSSQPTSIDRAGHLPQAKPN
jgi:hypothetical protein